MTTQCRTCAVMILNPNAKNIFDQDDNEILNNIETLTGIRVKTILKFIRDTYVHMYIRAYADEAQHVYILL